MDLVSVINNIRLQENNGQSEKGKDKVNGNVKKRELSESESSWSSVEEMETKVVTERDNEDNMIERAKKQTKLPRRKSRSNSHESEITEDHEEAAQLRPLLTPSS